MKNVKNEYKGLEEINMRNSSKNVKIYPQELTFYREKKEDKQKTYVEKRQKDPQENVYQGKKNKE